MVARPNDFENRFPNPNCFLPKKKKKQGQKQPFESKFSFLIQKQSDLLKI